MDEQQEREIRARIDALLSEHRDLDDMIARVSERAPFDQLQMQRMKKRKLAIKDQIARLETMLIDDIIA
ncbi:MAG: YdcH family protein [Alphaproteobacteria bacterium]|nr:YdcH family protein [Alphaproteobacteria bacterium]